MAPRSPEPASPRRPPQWVPPWPSARPPAIPFSLVRRSSMILADTGERINSSDMYGTVKVSARGSESTPLLEGSDNAVYTDDEPVPVKRSEPVDTSADSLDIAWNVFKCTLTYTIASLFVFTQVGDIFGVSGSKHQVATVGIYFHPARSMGGMLRSMGYVTMMLAYALMVALLSMLLAQLFYDVQWFGVGYLVMLILFCGGSLGGIGYLKIRMSNPTFDTACTVAIIFLVISLIKEDDIQYGILSLDQLFRYLSMVVSGVCLSALICFRLRPSYASTAFKGDLHKLMASYSDTMVVVLNSFVRGKSISSDEFNSRFQKAQEILKKTKADLSQAKLELSLAGKPDEYALLLKIFQSHTRISMHLGGLTHCTLVLDQLLAHPSPSPLAKKGTDDTLSAATSSPSKSPLKQTLRDSARKISAGILFQAFIYHLGPPMNSFATTLYDITADLPFDSAGKVHYNSTHVSSLRAAIALYSDAREKALENVYSHRVFGPRGAASVKTSSAALFSTPGTDKKGELVSATEDESVVATCGNFSYLLEDLGEEISVLLGLLGEYESLSEQSTWDPRAIFSLWRQSPSARPFSKVTKTLYPKHHLREEPKTLGYRLWSLSRHLRKLEVQFALKVGVGATIIAAPAFFPRTRPYFERWRGEWAIIVYMIMMARNLGAMTTAIPYRFVGTLTGALVAILAWYVSQGNPYILLPFGIPVAALCFYWILTNSNPFGRFVLLTYNLICLYGYSISADLKNGDAMASIIDIAFHRTVAVSAGVLWALFITVAVLPHSARSALRRDLSTQWMRMGMIWMANPLGTLPRKDANNPSATLQGVYGEDELQDAMLNLQTLLSNAPNEFRLRGSFDPAPFKKMLHATQIILDAYHSLGILISKSPTASSKELELIELTKPEVKELSNSLFLYFYTASSSLRVGFPVPENLPVPMNAIESMLRKLKQHRTQLLEVPDDTADTEDFVLFYSYVLATLTVLEQLAIINDILRDLYGTFYENLFTYN